MSLSDSIKNHFYIKHDNPKDILYATISILFGTFMGVASYILSFKYNLAIFGWNIAFALSPLIAGYCETFLSKKIMDETTGAISAYLLFFVTVVHGFILTNPTLGFNGISIGVSLIILQSAFPIAFNYLFFVVFLGILSYILGLFKPLTDKLYFTLVPFVKTVLGREFTPPKYRLTTENFAQNLYEEKDPNEHGILFLTSSEPYQINIKEYIGLREGFVIISNENKLFEVKTKQEELILLIRFKEAKDMALKRLAESVKEAGGNGVIDLEIDYNIVGELAGDKFHIVAKGIVVVFEGMPQAN
ncbi:hypothetical protein [Methanobrevibacter sp.]